MADSPALFEIMYTMRSMRRLKPDPVPDELIEQIVEAGTMAPSGGNTQGWSFIVVKEPAKKRFVQERYHKAFSAYAQVRMAEAQAAADKGEAPPPDPAQMRMANAAFYLADHMHEAPVLLFACMQRRNLSFGSDPQSSSDATADGASIYPAVQNMLLTCRALGLGTVLTTLHRVFEDEIKAELGVPENVDLCALLPIGYPQGNFGPVSRRPAPTLTYWDAWGATKE